MSTPAKAPQVSVLAYLQKRKEVWFAQKDAFYSIFKVRLDNRFWSSTTGFDIIAFDEWLEPKDGESTNDAVLRLYGSAGVEVILALIGKPA